MNSADQKRWFNYAKKHGICYSWNVLIYKYCHLDDESCGNGDHICTYCLFNDLGRQRHQSKGEFCPSQTKNFNRHLSRKRSYDDDTFEESETRPSSSNNVSTPSCSGHPRNSSGATVNSAQQQPCKCHATDYSSRTSSHQQPPPAPLRICHTANLSGASVNQLHQQPHYTTRRPCHPNSPGATVNTVQQQTLPSPPRSCPPANSSAQQQPPPVPCSCSRTAHQQPPAVPLHIGHSANLSGASANHVRQQPPTTTPRPPGATVNLVPPGATVNTVQQQPPSSQVRKLQESTPSTEAAGVESGAHQGGDVGERDKTHDGQNNYDVSWRPNYGEIHKTFGSNNEQQSEVGGGQKKKSAFSLPPLPTPPQSIHHRGDLMNNNSQEGVTGGNSISKEPPEQSAARERDFMADEIKQLRCIIENKDKQLNGLRSENKRVKNENLLLKAEVFVLKNKSEDPPKAQPKTNPMFQVQGFGKAAHNQNPMFQRPAPVPQQEMFQNQVFGPVVHRQPKQSSLQNPMFERPPPDHQRENEMFGNQVLGPVVHRQQKQGSLQNPVFRVGPGPVPQRQRGNKQKYNLENVPPGYWLNGDGTISPF